MNQPSDTLATAVFAEILTIDQLARNRLSKALPKGMELSHFNVLNYLCRLGQERTPAQLAATLNLTRGAMTNTLNKLEVAGHIHIRPDWDDARRKLVSVSGAGKAARDSALAAVTPILQSVVQEIGPEKVRMALPVLRQLRERLSAED